MKLNLEDNRFKSLSEYSAHSRESGDSSVATGVSRWNERAKRLSAVGAKNVDLSPLARLETRANENHRLTPVATGVPPLRGFERRFRGWKANTQRNAGV